MYNFIHNAGSQNRENRLSFEFRSRPAALGQDADSVNQGENSKGERPSHNPNASRNRELKPTDDQEEQIKKNEELFDGIIEKILKRIYSHLGETKFDELQKKETVRHGKYQPFVLTKENIADYPKVVTEYIRLYNRKIEIWETIKSRAQEHADEEGVFANLIKEQKDSLEFGPHSLAFRLDEIERKYAGKRPEEVEQMTPERFQQLVEEDIDAFHNDKERYKADPTATNRQLMLNTIGRIEQRVGTEQHRREAWGLLTDELRGRVRELRSIVADTENEILVTLGKWSEKALKDYKPFKENTIRAAMRIIQEEGKTLRGVAEEEQSQLDASLASSLRQFDLDSGATSHGAKKQNRFKYLEGYHTDLDTLAKRVPEDLKKMRAIAIRERNRQGLEKPVITDAAEVQNIQKEIQGLQDDQRYYFDHNATFEDPEMEEFTEAEKLCRNTLKLQNAEVALYQLDRLEQKASGDLSPEEGRNLHRTAHRALQVLGEKYRELAGIDPSRWRDSLQERIAGEQVPDAEYPDRKVWSGGAREAVQDMIRDLAIYDPEFYPQVEVEEGVPELPLPEVHETDPELFAIDTDNIPPLDEIPHPIDTMRQHKIQKWIANLDPGAVQIVPPPETPDMWPDLDLEAIVQDPRVLGFDPVLGGDPLEGAIPEIERGPKGEEAIVDIPGFPSRAQRRGDRDPGEVPPYFDAEELADQPDGAFDGDHVIPSA